jgi:hypothetical protein
MAIQIKPDISEPRPEPQPYTMEQWRETHERWSREHLAKTRDNSTLAANCADTGRVLAINDDLR